MIKSSFSTAFALIKRLSMNGHRVFTTEQAKTASTEEFGHIPIKKLLAQMKNQGWAYNLRKGLYALFPIFQNGIPIHDYEIAMALTDNGCISLYSAFHHHGLTEQLPHTIFISVIQNSTVPLIKGKRACFIEGVEYRFIQIAESLFFGHEIVWINNAKRITITDFERTLLDGLRSPQYCGGFQEVLHAFQVAKNKINYEKIVNYANKMEISVSKRLGYILEKMDVEEGHWMPLLDVPSKGYKLLDPSGPRKGTYNKKWMMIENI